MDLDWAGAEYARRMVKQGNYSKDFRSQKDFSEFKGLNITSPDQPTKMFGTNILHKPQTNSAPTSAGAKMMDAEKDKIRKQSGQLN